MPLLGAGVLAIWNGVTPGTESEFAEWHVREHMPERLGVPGFLRGRRYRAIEGHPAFFNFYETESPAVLTSPLYVARLNAPSDWTRRVVAQFRDTGRTVCDIVSSHGRGEGGTIETVQMSFPATAADHADLLKTLLAAPGITGVHLLRGRAADSAGGTAEKALRDGPDMVADGALLIEAISVEAIRAARAGAGSDDALGRAGFGDVTRGIYNSHFSLVANEGVQP